MKKKMKLTKQGMQYFDGGGQVQEQGTTSNYTAPYPMTRESGGTTLSNIQANPTGQSSSDLANPMAGISTIGALGQGLASAFTAQNQYQAQLAPQMQSSYQSLIDRSSGNALNGAQQYNQTLTQQNALAKALLAQGQGQGPNPAQIALQNQTGQNIASQGALAAGQRGSAQNVGLIARQVGQQGAQTQQNAIGQAAQLQAQQQIAAQQNAANLLGQIGGQNIAQQNAATNLFGTAAGAQNTQNSNEIQNYNMMQGINSQVAQNNANAVNKTTGSMLNSIGGGISSMLAEGGEVPNPKVAAVAPSKRFQGNLKPHVEHMAKLYHPAMFASGGDVGDSASVDVPKLSGGQGVDFDIGGGGDSGGGSGGGGGGGLGSLIGLAALAAGGGEIPGKPKVNKNDYKNDVVPAMLTPKEIVLPLSVTQSDDPGEAARDFVNKLKGKYAGSKDSGEFKSSLKKAIGNRKVK